MYIMHLDHGLSIDTAELRKQSHKYRPLQLKLTCKQTGYLQGYLLLTSNLYCPCKRLNQ